MKAQQDVLHGRTHLDDGIDPTPGAGVVVLNAIIDGGGPISAGIKGDVQIDSTYEIVACTLLADAVGDIVVDIWKDTYANYPPDSADSIVASAPPTLSSEDHSRDETLTGWTTTINPDDVLRFNVDSASGVSRVNVALSLRAREAD